MSGFSGGGGGGGGASGDVLVTVAASNTPAARKALADYICDGTADEVEINAAVASIAAIGGTVFLLAGTYTTSGPITWAVSNITLRGEGMTATVIQNSGSGDLTLPLIDLTTGSTYATLTDFSLREAVAFTGKGIWSHDADCTIRQVHLVALGTGNDQGAIAFRGVRGRVENCRMLSWWVGLDINMLAESPVVEGCYITNAKFAAIASNGQYSRFVGNVIENTVVAEAGIELAGLGSWSVISDNRISGIVDIGIVVQSTGCEGVVVSDNVVVGSTSFGIKTYGIQGLVTGNVVQGVTGTGGAGIYSYGANVCNNSVYANAGHGIKCPAFGAVIAGNLLWNNGSGAATTYDGIYVDGDQNLITDNLIRYSSASPRYGINIASGSQNVCRNNDLYRSGVTGALNDAGIGTNTTLDANGNRTS